MKKLYITGGAGMLGSNIAFLLKNKYQIILCDKIAMDASDVEVDTFDLCDFEMLEKSIKMHQPDYVIHTAAMVNVDLCEEKKEKARLLNFEVTKKLANLCNENHFKMVYISTDAVFDGENEKLYTENDKTCPINYYGLSKLKGEEIVLDNNFTVLRTNIYGYNIQNKNSFGEWIYNALRNDEILGMFTDIDFSPILVNDLAMVIEKIIEKDITGLFHVCATGKISKYEFGIILKEVFGIEFGQINAALSEDASFKAKRSKHMGMNNKKICKLLEISLPTPEESVKKFYQLMCENYPKNIKEWGKIQCK